MAKQNFGRHCPKCGGRVFLYVDLYGWYEQCINCSHTYNLEINSLNALSQQELVNTSTGGSTKNTEM